MDLQKLVESQGKLARRSAAGGSAANADVLNRPVELRQAQADRLKERIESLERSKAALVESIDAELEQLKQELATRTESVQVERKRLEGAVKAVTEAVGKAGKAFENAAKDSVVDPKDKKSARGAAAGKDDKPS